MPSLKGSPSLTKKKTKSNRAKIRPQGRAEVGGFGGIMDLV